ncbi:MAG TPA: hypothetical protein PLP88_12435 [Bacteroidales bacterium]|nr:hypothetical protein [Bacteroidales bacterium]
MRTELVETSENYIPIPEDRRVIAFRVSYKDLSSPYRLSYGNWPKSGSIKAETERGLYACALGQNYGYILLMCMMPKIYFRILEVDASKILYVNVGEIAFTEANVLYYGDIAGFLTEIQKHATLVQYADLIANFGTYLIEEIESGENQRKVINQRNSTIEIIEDSSDFSSVRSFGNVKNRLLSGFMNYAKKAGTITPDNVQVMQYLRKMVEKSKTTTNN